MFQVHICVPAASARTREGLVNGDSSEPCRESRPAVELPQVAVGVHVGLLHDVLGLALVLDDRSSGPVHPLVVAPH